MSLSTIHYLNAHGELTSVPLINPSNEVVLKGYQTMMLTRIVDERMITLQRQGLISFALSSLGEEACAVASAAALEIQDWMYPQYREAGIMFWRGMTPLQYINHMFGNCEDPSYGRQMPNHFGSRDLNVVTVSSPIGTQIPHAAGCAYAMKLQKESSIAICYFGEGAASEGDFHAGINFAAVRKVPAIFFCRNNGYAISTPTFRQYAGEGIAERGKGYGISSFKVDGNDFFAIFDTVSKARDLCLQGKGPVLIEAMTYRVGSHSTSDDPTLYRSDEEVAVWKEKDPVLRLRRFLEKNHLWDEKKENELHKKMNETVSEAIAKAKETPRKSLSYIVENVYFEEPECLKKEYEEIKILFPEK